MTNTQSPEFTATALPTVTIGSQEFTAEAVVTTWTDKGEAKSDTTIQLYGKRGAVYFLRAAGNTGIFQIISWKSGAPLRVRGNEVRATMLGDIIEAV